MLKNFLLAFPLVLGFVTIPELCDHNKHVSGSSGLLLSSPPLHSQCQSRLLLPPGGSYLILDFLKAEIPLIYRRNGECINFLQMGAENVCGNLTGQKRIFTVPQDHLDFRIVSETASVAITIKYVVMEFPSIAIFRKNFTLADISGFLFSQALDDKTTAIKNLTTTLTGDSVVAVCVRLWNLVPDISCQSNSLVVNGQSECDSRRCFSARQKINLSVFLSDPLIVNRRNFFILQYYNNLDIFADICSLLDQELSVRGKGLIHSYGYPRKYRVTHQKVCAFTITSKTFGFIQFSVLDIGYMGISDGPPDALYIGDKRLLLSDPTTLSDFKMPSFPSQPITISFTQRTSNQPKPQFLIQYQLLGCKLNKAAYPYAKVIQEHADNATINCEKGYWINSHKTSLTITCNATTQEWSTHPVCSMILCPEPVLPSFSVVCNGSSNQAYVGQKIILTCVDGYSLSGDTTWTCTENGTWSGENFTHCVDHSRGIYRHYVHQDLVIGLVVGLSLLAVLLIILILHAVTWKSQVSRFCYQRVYGYCKSEVQTSVGADVYRSITPDSLESHINTTNHHNQSSSILPVREEANKVIADSRPSCQRVLLNFSDEVTSRGRHSDMKIAEETTPSTQRGGVDTYDYDPTIPYADGVTPVRGHYYLG